MKYDTFGYPIDEPLRHPVDEEKPLKKPRNPLVFDSNWDGPEIVLSTELTLRDLFAAFSLMGLRSNSLDHSSDFIASLAGKDADAMLKERG